MTTAQEATSIRGENLTYIYPGTTTPAVSSVTLTADPGQVIALVGPSGCGKSTLLRVISGLLNPTNGSLYFGDTDASAIAPEHRGVGWVPQSYALFEHLTVRENVAFGLRARKVDKREVPGRVDEALTMCHIEEFAGRYPAELSGGQRQRVAIARALATRPKVLLLDEPLAALDPQLRKSLRVTLAALLRDSGVTSVLVTHDQTEALAMADVVAVMRAGEIQQYDTPERLWRQPKNAFVAEFVGAATVVQASRSESGYAVAEGITLKDVSGDSAYVRVALRPGDLRIDEDGAGAQFRVLGHEYTGNEWLLSGELVENGEVLTVLAAKHEEVGSVHTVGLRPGASVATVQG